MDRRDFVKAAAVAAVAPVVQPSPTVIVPSSFKPLVIASANGHKYRNGGPRTAIEEVFLRITRGDDVLESLVAGVGILELDPEESSVGYGGIPNADGVVQLDSCVMHGPRRRAGGVAALEGVRTAARVALAVADLTDHHLLVGDGAQQFARQVGFTIEPDLNTDHSRRKWQEWRRRIDPSHWLDPAKRTSAGDRARAAMLAEGLLDPDHVFGTINCLGMNARGEVCGVTTTSGLDFKIPGRVGDSPILGAGLYVDGDVGAAGSTGRGEANLYGLSSFSIVEQLRAGKHPKDAGLEALRRVKERTTEKRLLNSRGLPNFNLKFYALDRQGRNAGVSLYGGTIDGVVQNYAVHTENGPEMVMLEPLLPGSYLD